MMGKVGSLCMLVAITLVGCMNPTTKVRLEAGKDYYRPLEAGQHALRKVTDPALIPDFTKAFADLGDLRKAVEHSIHYLSKSSSRSFFPMSGIEHVQVEQSLLAFRELLDSGKSPAEMAAELRRCFDVYSSVGCDDMGTVLFTGYYTPIFEASLTRGGQYQYPLHKLPSNHVKDPITGQTLGRRLANGEVDPHYPDRAALLASGELDGNELAWLTNPFEAYVAMVQGSAILRLQDETHIEIGYAGNNGRDYTSLGMELIRSGKMRREQLNLRSMIAYFNEHPEDFEPLAAKNERYVFFQESAGGPFGTINEQVLAMRSLATDKSIFPRGSLCFLSTILPGADGNGLHPYQGFALDQDAGGAIRAPGRCDIFMGVGDQAGERAGHVYAEGRLYYLILKDGESPLVSR